MADTLAGEERERHDTSWWTQTAQRVRDWWQGTEAPAQREMPFAPNPSLPPADLSHLDHVTYGKLMLELTERSIGPWVDRQGVAHERLTLPERETQVRAWADYYAERRPDLAQALQETAAQYHDIQARTQAAQVVRTVQQARARLTQHYEARHEREQRQEVGYRY